MHAARVHLAPQPKLGEPRAYASISGLADSLRVDDEAEHSLSGCKPGV